MIETTSEIARCDWRRALDEFNAIHEGWLVSVQVLSPQIGAQPDIISLPLLGITLDDTATGAIAIAAGTADNHIVHAIPAPTHVRLARVDHRADAALEIEAADGTHTIVTFRSVVAPELVDGWP